MLKISSSGDIELTRGDTAWLTVAINDDNGEAYTVKGNDVLTLSLKKKAVDEEPILLQKIIKGTDTFHIQPEDTAKLEFGKYKYDVELTTAGGDVFTVIPPAVFKILAEVTS